MHVVCRLAHGTPQVKRVDRCVQGGPRPGSVTLWYMQIHGVVGPGVLWMTPVPAPGTSQTLQAGL